MISGCNISDRKNFYLKILIIPYPMIKFVLHIVWKDKIQMIIEVYYMLFNINCDYEIECNGNKTIKTIATGFSIQHNEDWVDPRREQNENYCE